MTGSSAPEPERPSRIGAGGRLRNYFLAGILTTAPVCLTIYIAWIFTTWVDDAVFALVPPRYNPDTYLPVRVPGIGLIIALIGITLIGAVTTGLLGRLMRQLMEAVLNRLPIIRSVYSVIKQVTETVVANRSEAFRECALIEYPRQGSWTVGFITGSTYATFNTLTGEDLVNVFVPTTPNPTSGFLMFIPRSQVQILDMSVEDGLKLVISLGLVLPQPPGEIAAQPERNVLTTASRSKR
ncbi:MAG TPA: DUF502 domain-containing protein [Dongiaceae bacterium]|nr:DUF502 domain-containing protein [Dongiaceae bacterium]